MFIKTDQQTNACRLMQIDIEDKHSFWDSYLAMITSRKLHKELSSCDLPKGGGKDFKVKKDMLKLEKVRLCSKLENPES